MRKALLSLVVLCVLLASLFLWPSGEANVSDWKVVVPEATTNLLLNPSIEIDTTSWVAFGAAISRDVATSVFGEASLRMVTDDAGVPEGAYTIVSDETAINTEYTFSCYLRGSGTVRLLIWDNTGGDQYGPIITLTDAWTRHEWTAAFTTGAQRAVAVYTDIQQATTFWADGLQLEQAGYSTTYCDGSRDGCEWNGTPHASTSQRSAQSRAGGRVRDLQTDYALDISGMVGVGTPTLVVNVDEYALLPGGETGHIKDASRTFILTGAIHGTSLADLHAKRQALITLFDVNAHPESQPVTLRYTGGAVVKEIEVYYEDGLRGTLRAADDACNKEKVVIRFVAPDPFWYEVGEQSQALDTLDRPGYFTIAARLKSTGQWDNLGPPNAAGAYHVIDAIAIAPDKTVYVGGHYTLFDNQVSGTYIIRWDPVAGTWSTLGVGLDDNVRAIVIAPDGMVYLAGDFTDIRTNPGGGTYNYVVRWDPVAGTYNALGVGMDDDVYTLAWGQDGTLYAGGWFHNAGGGAALHVAQWDGANWAAVGAGLDNPVNGSVVGPDGGIYFAGEFGDIVGGPGETYSRLIKWNPTTATWTSLTAGRIFTGGHLHTITIYKDGTVYFGGNFPIVNPGAEVFNDVGLWNGTSLIPLAGGVNEEVFSLGVGPTGLLYVGGEFTEAGGIPMERLAVWDGSAWVLEDFRMPAAEAVFAITIGDPDPVVPGNYDIYLGFATPLGLEEAAGSVVVTNPGTAHAHPILKVSRAGGSAAKLISVRNETTGKAIRFNYDLLDGETLTIDLGVAEKSIISDFRGRRAEARLASGDFGSFDLQPGVNQVTCLVHPEHRDFNDNNNQLSGWEGITGIVTGVNTDANGILYASIVDLGAGLFRVDFYRNVARAGADLVGHSLNYDAASVQRVDEDLGSGLGGYIRIDAATAADVDIYMERVFVEAHIEWTNTYRSLD